MKMNVQACLPAQQPRAPNLSARCQRMLRFAQNNLYYRTAQETKAQDFVDLGMAENLLTQELVHARLDVSRQQYRGHANSRYAEYRGVRTFREAMANYYSQVLASEIDPENIIAAAGATPIVEMIVFAIAEPGDAILVLAPWYPGFDLDVGSRTGVSMVPVPRTVEEEYQLTEEALARAMHEAGSAGRKVRGILLSNPDNPTGRVYSKEELYLLSSFAENHDLHILADEIYAGSVYEGNFLSFLALQPGSQHIHVITGLSKDFCMAGYRVGCLISNHAEILQSLAKLCRFCSISLDTQFLLADFLSDADFVEFHIAESKRRIKHQHRCFAETLARLGLKSYSSRAGGLFVWLDFRGHLREATDEEEERLFSLILKDSHVRITPGQCCHATERGFFRACITTCPDYAVLDGAMDRIANTLASLSARD